MSIKENIANIRKQIPSDVIIVLAAKTRTKEEVLEAIEAGATDIGMNYVQETVQLYKDLGARAKDLNWHMIGHLQKNKLNKALPIFDTIQTVDSYELAQAISKKTTLEDPNNPKNKKTIFIEINSAREPQKAGVMPEDAEELIRKLASLPNINVQGLMTMGPVSDPELLRQCFKETKQLFDKINKLNIPNINLKTLSMGMSNSYKIAIEEGANMIRLGTVIFGPRS